MTNNSSNNINNHNNIIINNNINNNIINNNNNNNNISILLSDSNHISNGRKNRFWSNDSTGDYLNLQDNDPLNMDEDGNNVMNICCIYSIM